jgi:RNA polymerase sigma factor (sigma-70 family)
MAHGALQTLLKHVRHTAGDTGPLSDAQLLDHYLARRDEAAFAALVRRHGGLVLAACRRVLTDEADIEDAFQATFLVLLRKAATIHHRQALGGWLYRVAARAAAQARSAVECRRRVEQRAASVAGVSDPGHRAAPDPSWREVCALLHAELDRLPVKLRLPLILCYLDGRSRDEAAQQLGWSLGTLRGRLERGRSRLRARLTRRGVELSAGLLSAVAGDAVAGGPLPQLVRLTVAAVGRPSQAVAALARGVSAGLAVGPAKVAAGLALVVGLLAGGAGLQLLVPAGAAPTDLPGGREAAPAKPAAEPAEVSGRVLGPTGQPVPGTKVYLTLWWGYHFEQHTEPPSATTGPDGQFAFTAPKAKYHDQPIIVSAAAPNLGVGWAGLHKGEKRTDLTLKLVADDVPVTGQIVDLEGKPVAGATVRVLQIMASPKEDLGPWLEATKDKAAPPHNRSTNLEQEHLSRYTTAPQAVVTTDAAGRFRLAGIGRERLAIVRLDGPTIASQHLRIRTRPGAPFEVPWMAADFAEGSPRIDHTYYGADFRHAAGPTKPVVGVVRDKDTKAPLAGVTVQSDKLAHNPLHGSHIVQTTTDAQGRYRLVGLPTGKGNKIKLVPPRDRPYVAPTVDVPDSPGLDPVTVDIELKRGVWIEGKITDKVTGKPIRTGLMYHVRGDNPNQDDYLGFFGSQPGVGTNEDGTYRIVGLPGPGQIVVWRQEHYLRGADRDDEDGPPANEFGYMPAVNFAAFARVDPPKGAESVKRDITLIPGWTFTGTILGPDGKPLAGARACGLSGWGQWEREALKTAEFTVREFNPRRPRPVLFRNPETGLVGVAQPPAESGGRVTVRMEPGATVTGRLVDVDSEPRARVELTLSFRLRKGLEGESYLREPIRTDAAGRFRIPALLSGYQYKLSDDKGELPARASLTPSQTTDLGDVRIKPAE